MEQTAKQRVEDLVLRELNKAVENHVKSRQYLKEGLTPDEYYDMLDKTLVGKKIHSNHIQTHPDRSHSDLREFKLSFKTYRYISEEDDDGN